MGTHLRRALAPAILGCLPLAGCADHGGDASTNSDAARAASWPDGTVLALGDEPITAEEVDAYLELIHLIEPQMVKTDHRRKALTNIILPVAAGRALFPEERQAAFLLAQSLAAEARETGRVPAGAPEPMYLTGTWRDVGMTAWELARTTEVGAFSAIQETPGSWTFVHVLATGLEPGEPFDARTPVTIQRYDIPYIESQAARDLIQSTMDQFHIEVVDPEWESVVPARLLYPRSPNDG